ncbi:alpha-glucosidase C-terminal domain-containing protein, partial [Phenylobacterium sp.]|uniref:alpha-amylase family glycosyl hydrolase n=1 Tax=Phenylobacterium sp. TaxID=1871053 RepID=UPI002F3EC6B6
SVLDLWLSRGVDGFRLDVAGTFLHDPQLRPNPPVPPPRRRGLNWSHAGNLQYHWFDSNLPENVETLDVIRRRVEAHDGKNGGERPAPELANLLFALLVSLKGTTLIYQGEELGLPQASLTRGQLRDPVGDLYWPYSGGRDGCRTPMPWAPGPALGFTTGTPWLPAAREHTEFTVQAQEADPESNLAFARTMIAFRTASPAMTSGSIEFLEVAEPVLGFVRRDGDEVIACLFNLSAEPRFVDVPELDGAIMLEVRAGDAELRGGSIGLSAYAAAFLRL